jgi:hypothetical protein
VSPGAYKGLHKPVCLQLPLHHQGCLPRPFVVRDSQGSCRQHTVLF